jgi:hypothetical protein
MSGVIHIVISLIAVFAAGFAIFNLLKLNRRFESALGGSSAESLERSLAQHHRRISQVNERLEELDKKYTDLTLTASVASQKISIVRFNPFGDTGGDQSFSLAVLDAHDSGYALTSIHGRQGTRVYIKPIDYGKSKYSLSDEEQQAISQAIRRVPHVTPDESEIQTKQGDKPHAPQIS